jgi:hypothetical protein
MEDVVVCALDFDQPLPGLLLLAAVAACRGRCHQLGGWAQINDSNRRRGRRPDRKTRFGKRRRKPAGELQVSPLLSLNFGANGVLLVSAALSMPLSLWLARLLIGIYW